MNFVLADSLASGSLTIPLSAGDQGTEETIAVIRQLVDEGLRDPVINRQALAIVRGLPSGPFLVPAYQFPAEVRAIYEWVRRHIRFTRDIAGKETLRTAREILHVGAGDCDDINAILLPALLGSIGHRLRLVTISAHPLSPDTFSHIYAEIWLGGKWVPLDAARRDAAFGKGPRRYFRKRVWSLSTSDFSDVAGLGYYSSLGFDWGSFADAASKIGQTVGGIVQSIRAPSSYITPPSSGAGSSAVVVQRPAGSFLPQSLPSWVLPAGFGLLGLMVLMQMRRK